MADDLNAREQLEACAWWLSMQHEDLSYGLKSPVDGLKLWSAWIKDPELPEFCDQYEDSNDAKTISARVRKILGYDPWKRAAEMAEAA